MERRGRRSLQVLAVGVAVLCCQGAYFTPFKLFNKNKFISIDLHIQKSHTVKQNTGNADCYHL